MKPSFVPADKWLQACEPEENDWRAIEKADEQAREIKALMRPGDYHDR